MCEMNCCNNPCSGSQVMRSARYSMQFVPRVCSQTFSADTLLLIGTAGGTAGNVLLKDEAGVGAKAAGAGGGANAAGVRGNEAGGGAKEAGVGAKETCFLGGG
jgi:hypothetical protein